MMDRETLRKLEIACEFRDIEKLLLKKKEPGGGTHAAHTRRPMSDETKEKIRQAVLFNWNGFRKSERTY